MHGPGSLDRASLVADDGSDLDRAKRLYALKGLADRVGLDDLLSHERDAEPASPSCWQRRRHRGAT